MLRNLFIISVMSFLFFQMKSQNVTICLDSLVTLKSDLHKSKQKVESLEKFIETKEMEETNLNKKLKDLKNRLDSLQSRLNSNDFAQERYDSLLRLKDNEILNLRKENKNLQELSDLSLAKLANGRLYFKYDEELVKNSIDSLMNLKSEKIKKRFEQALTLLIDYKNHLDDVRNTILNIQAIDEDERESKYRSEEYKKHCLLILKNSGYYQNVYSKISNGNWSIPYLDNVIDIAKSIISKHDPIDYKFANFGPLIEMLR